MKIEDINRTSTFAWSQDIIAILATGTVAGAVDVNFNSSSSLELWDIFLATNTKEPIFSASVENRFYGLAWSKPFEGRPHGLLAAAFENGVVEFWDPEILIKSKDLEKASVHKSSKHSGAVKCLQFNPIEPHILVTGGSKGEIFIWDTKSFADPFSPGKAMTPMDEITSVAWNNSVSHIFASTSNGGYTSIWDLKSKREVLHLSYNGPLGRAEFSSVAWHPSQSTKLVTASESDGCPVILTWDLRNSNEPEKCLQGHKKGVLSIDWCKQDQDLLLSSGKDNSTILWNPITNEKIAEYPTTANWAFHCRFAPASPDIFATASFDGKVIVQSLQDTSPPVSTKVTSNDDNEFWNEISTTETQQPIFTKVQAPKWMKNPSSVSFGFGSKLVQVSTNEQGKSSIILSKFAVNSGSEVATEELQKALESSDFKPIIESKVKDASLQGTDKADWELLQKLAENGKDHLFSNILGEEPEQEEKVNGKPAAEESFFDNLSSNGSSEAPFVPLGEFELFSKTSETDKRLVKLLLSNKIESAVDECLKTDKLLEALVLSLDASAATKEKVKASYFKKHDTGISRLIYSASSNNILDIVSHADVGDWKEIASSISAFTTDSEDFNVKIIELGDRILEKDSSQRENAMLCYLAGNALDKVGSIWLKELSGLEEHLLKSNDKISTPSDARFEALNNFVEKLTAYRSISKISGELTGPSIEPIGKAILEYSNLVASYGQFELASKLLLLLPNDFEGMKLEKERISKILDKPKPKSNRYTSSPAGKPAALGKPRGLAKAPAASRTASVGPSYAPTPLAPYVPAMPAVAPAQPAPVPAQLSAQFAQPPAPYAPAPAAAPAPVAQAYRPNPYAAASPNLSSPYNPYKPVQAAASGPSAPSSGAVAPPPPRNKYKEETEGWNDLPETFKAKTAPPRRATAAAVASPSPSPGPMQPVAPSMPPRKPSVASPGGAAPPPPKGVSRVPSKTSLTSPKLAAATARETNRRYAPPPAAVAAAPAEGLTPPPAFLGLNRPSTPGSAVKNPYAPPAPNPYAPSAPSAFAPPAQNAYTPPPVASPPVATPPVAPPAAAPRNPYAPAASVEPTGPTGVPTPRFGGLTSIAPGLPAPPAVGPPPVAPISGSVPPPPPMSSTGSLPPPPPSAPAAAPAPSYPKGDRSHIPDRTMPIFTTLSTTLETIKPKVPEKYARHVSDIETRLSALFDDLNNETGLSEPAIDTLLEMCQALEAQDYRSAADVSVGFATAHPEDIGVWHTGVKRLINMAEAL